MTVPARSIVSVMVLRHPKRGAAAIAHSPPPHDRQRSTTSTDQPRSHSRRCKRTRVGRSGANLAMGMLVRKRTLIAEARNGVASALQLELECIVCGGHGNDVAVSCACASGELSGEGISPGHKPPRRQIELAEDQWGQSSELSWHERGYRLLGRPAFGSAQRNAREQADWRCRPQRREREHR